MNGSSCSGRGPRRRWRRGARAAAIVAGGAGLAMLAAACGGSSPSSAGGSTYYQQAVAYAQCMRSHGVPSFPDPDSQGQFPPVQTGRHGVSQAAVQSAQNACRHLVPGGPATAQQQHARTAQALAFSRCMRAHGVPGFPDPSTSNSGIGWNLSGVDIHAPQYQSANRTCQSQLARGRSSAGGKS